MDRDRATKQPEGSRGQGLVEFALALPVILLLFFAIFDLGRAVYAYSTIADAARTGSRVAIVDQNLSTDCVAQPAVARCAAANQALALGITAEDVTIQYLARDLGSGCPTPQLIDCIAEVTVPYSYSAVTPILSNIVGTIDMSSIARLPIERSYDSSAP